MTNTNKKKLQQLGMSQGRASGRLKKALMLQLARRLALDNCYRCSEIIDSPEELSIDHKEPWLDSDDPITKFFDLDNVAFSHSSCNSAAARPVNKKYNTVEQRAEAHRISARNSKRRLYSAKRRRQMYLDKGY